MSRLTDKADTRDTADQDRNAHDIAACLDTLQWKQHHSSLVLNL